jgi:hypothetical protein
VHGDPAGDPIAQTTTFLHGPHPLFESDLGLFCQDVAPYVLDP